MFVMGICLNLFMMGRIIPPDDKQTTFVLPMEGVRIFVIRHVLPYIKKRLIMQTGPNFYVIEIASLPEVLDLIGIYDPRLIQQF